MPSCLTLEGEFRGVGHEKPCWDPALTAEVWGCLFSALVWQRQEKLGSWQGLRNMSYNFPDTPCLSFPTPLTSQGMNFAFILPSPSETPGERCDFTHQPDWQRSSSSLGVPQQPLPLSALASECRDYQLKPAAVGFALIVQTNRATDWYLCPSQ